MNSQDVALLEANQSPRLHVSEPWTETDGDLAAKLGFDYGLGPDVWQQLILDDWLAVSPTGKYANKTCGLAVPRQNGKNGVLELRELYGMIGRHEKILHTAHEVKTAQKHFRRLKYFFGDKANDPSAKFPELNALVRQVRSVNGQEAIFLHGGGSIEIVARSKNSSRGFTVDVLVFDEAQELSEDAKEALLPTTSSAPLGNPQWIYTGTPPGPAAAGEAFTRTRTTALTGRRRISWIEWSIPEGVKIDIRNHEHMYATNPQLERTRPNGSFGLQMETVLEELEELSEGGFARERLGRWASLDGTSRAIEEHVWNATKRDQAPTGIPVLGVAFNLSGDRMSVAGGIRTRLTKEPEHVELLAHSTTTDRIVRKFTQWIVHEQRWKRYGMILISGRSHAELLRKSLRLAGVPERVIRIASTPEYFTACAMLFDSLIDGSVTHLDNEGQAVLDDAVSVTDKQRRGAKGEWGWYSTREDMDETPVEAISLALYASRTATRDPNKKGKVL